MARLFKLTSQWSRIETHNDSILKRLWSRLLGRPRYRRVSPYDNGFRDAMKAHQLRTASRVKRSTPEPASGQRVRGQSSSPLSPRARRIAKAYQSRSRRKSTAVADATNEFAAAAKTLSSKAVLQDLAKCIRWRRIIDDLVVEIEDLKTRLQDVNEQIDLDSRPQGEIKVAGEASEDSRLGRATGKLDETVVERQRISSLLQEMETLAGVGTDRLRGEAGNVVLKIVEMFESNGVSRDIEDLCQVPADDLKQELFMSPVLEHGEQVEDISDIRRNAGSAKRPNPSTSQKADPAMSILKGLIDPTLSKEMLAQLAWCLESLKVLVSLEHLMDEDRPVDRSLTEQLDVYKTIEDEGRAAGKTSDDPSMARPRQELVAVEARQSSLRENHKINLDKLERGREKLNAKTLTLLDMIKEKLDSGRFLRCMKGLGLELDTLEHELFETPAEDPINTAENVKSRRGQIAFAAEEARRMKVLPWSNQEHPLSISAKIKALTDLVFDIDVFEQLTFCLRAWESYQSLVNLENEYEAQREALQEQNKTYKEIHRRGQYAGGNLPPSFDRKMEEWDAVQAKMRELNRKDRENKAKLDGGEEVLTSKLWDLIGLLAGKIQFVGVFHFLEDLGMINLEEIHRQLFGESKTGDTVEPSSPSVGEEQAIEDAIAAERDEARDAAFKADEEFERHQSGYREAKNDFLKGGADRLNDWRPDWTQEDFDIAWLKEGQRVTRNFRDAEQRLIDSMKRAQAAGVKPWDTQRCFFPDRESMAYPNVNNAQPGTNTGAPEIMDWIANMPRTPPRPRNGSVSPPSSVATNLEEPETWESCSCVAPALQKEDVIRANAMAPPPLWREPSGSDRPGA